MKKNFEGLGECIEIICKLLNNTRILIESVVDSDGNNSDYYVEITLYNNSLISEKEFKEKSLMVYSMLREKGYDDFVEKVVIRKG